MSKISAAFLCVAMKGAVVVAAPSVVVVIADDQGWGDLHANGNSNLQTPHIDSLRRGGVSFDRFYVQPVCSPTRAEVLTGRYAGNCGVSGVTGGAERLRAGIPTIADAFARAGYATAAFGKWHNGTQAPYHPLCRGFGHFYGFTSGHWADYYAPMLDLNGEVVRGSGFLPDDITEHAIRFIESSTKPYFVWVAYNTPHSPMQCPDRWWDRHRDQELAERGTQPGREDTQHTRAALAMCENLDWNVGRVVDAVQSRGDAILVYMTDNGPNGHRFNGGLRGIKGSTDEGGCRSPLYLWSPGRLPAGRRVKTPAAAIDVAPTLAALAGVELSDASAIDGVSLVDAIDGDDSSVAGRTLFTAWNGRVAARQGAWMLDEEQRLYNLDTDPGQQRDVSGENRSIASRLAASVESWRSATAEPAKQQPRPFTIGGSCLVATQLPARDARTRGQIKRSNRYFNCTYLTNWNSTDDAVVWDAEVLTPGTYEASIFYTCSPENTGCQLRLNWSEKACQARVTTAHDPPLTAAQRDLVPRKEGDMKRFAELTLGEIYLEAGRGELVLNATDITGESAIDFRLLVLRRR